MQRWRYDSLSDMMEPDDKGRYVLYADVEQLEQKIKLLKMVNKNLKVMLWYYGIWGEIKK